jgi:hypothetical protein
MLDYSHFYIVLPAFTDQQPRLNARQAKFAVAPPNSDILAAKRRKLTIPTALCRARACPARRSHPIPRTTMP